MNEETNRGQRISYITLKRQIFRKCESRDCANISGACSPLAELCASSGVDETKMRTLRACGCILESRRKALSSLIFLSYFFYFCSWTFLIFIFQILTHIEWRSKRFIPRSIINVLCPLPPCPLSLSLSTLLMVRIVRMVRTDGWFENCAKRSYLRRCTPAV